MATNEAIDRFPTPRHRGLHLLPKVILPIGAGLITLGAVGLALSRSGKPNTEQQFVPQAQGQDVPPPAGSDGDGEPPKLTELPVVAPLPTDSTTTVDNQPKPQEPTPSPPDKKKGKPVENGAIIPAELSTTGVFVDFEYQGQVYKLALYNLPDKTPITAPKDGYFVARKKAGAPFIGSDLSVFNPVDLTVPNIGLIGGLHVPNMLSRQVKKGEVVAYVQDTGEKMFGRYNFVVWITAENPTGKGFFSPDSPYQEYLPDLPKETRIAPNQITHSSPGNVYLPK